MNDSIPSTIRITLPPAEFDLDFDAFQQLRESDDGRVVAISYQHEPYYSHRSGPVVHFRLPGGRLVRAAPVDDGHELVWEDTQRRASGIDPAAAHVLDVLWSQLDAAFQDTLLPAFGASAITAMTAALEAGPPLQNLATASSSGSRRHGVRDLIGALILVVLTVLYVVGVIAHWLPVWLVAFSPWLLTAAVLLPARRAVRNTFIPPDRRDRTGHGS